MKRKMNRTVKIGILMTLLMPVAVVGCSKHNAQKPAGGYPGGQKAGAVNNATNDPDYAAKGKRGFGGPGAVNNSSPGYQGSGSGGQ